MKKEVENKRMEGKKETGGKEAEGEGRLRRGGKWRKGGEGKRGIEQMGRSKKKWSMEEGESRRHRREEER